MASSRTETRAGSGFDLRSQSTTTLGSAQAGMMTETDNASLIVNNPASLGWGNGHEVVFGATPIFTSAHFSDGLSSSLLGMPVVGSDGGDNGTNALLPNVFAATDIASQWRLGVAITSLYGLGSTWQPDWIGRYYAISSQLVTYDILPTLSYRPISSLSFGIAPIIQYARAKSTVAIDFGLSEYDAAADFFRVLAEVAAKFRQVKFTVIAAGRSTAPEMARHLEVAPRDASEEMIVAVRRARRLTSWAERDAGRAYAGIDTAGFAPDMIFPFHPVALSALRSMATPPPATIAVLSRLAREALATPQLDQKPDRLVYPPT